MFRKSGRNSHYSTIVVNVKSAHISLLRLSYFPKRKQIPALRKALFKMFTKIMLYYSVLTGKQ